MIVYVGFGFAWLLALAWLIDDYMDGYVKKPEFVILTIINTAITLYTMSLFH